MTETATLFLQAGPALCYWILMDTLPVGLTHCHKCDSQGNPTKNTLCGIEEKGHWTIDQIGDRRCPECNKIFESSLAKPASV